MISYFCCLFQVEFWILVPNSFHRLNNSEPIGIRHTKIMLTIVPRQLRTSLLGRLSNVLRGDLILKQVESSSLSRFPASLSVQSASVSTYMHDDKLHNDNIFPKPRRWPLYNDVVHKPEDGPVERVCLEFTVFVKLHICFYSITVTFEITSSILLRKCTMLPVL